MNIFEEEGKIKQAFSEKYNEKFLNDWKFTQFQKDVLLNVAGEGNSVADVKKRVALVNKHTNRDEFIEELLTITAPIAQCYSEFSKLTNSHEDRLINMLENAADEKVGVIADIGSVLVGNDDFQVALRNGIGDGFYPVYILHEDDAQGFNSGMLELGETISGKNFKISYTDIEPDWIEDISLSGRYFVYHWFGIVALVQYAEY